MPDATKSSSISPSPESLHGVDDVAALLRCSRRHIFRLIRSGRMPEPIRVGALLRWLPSVLNSWIASGCPATQSEAVR